MKDQLIFDVTDAATIADSDSVGAYVRSSDGTLITHKTVGGREALDVSVVDGINVEVDLSHIDDSVRLGDGTAFFTSTSENGDIALDVHISNSNIEVTQGTSPWVIGDGGSSITVDAIDLDIRDLTAASDSVESWTHDGTGTAITSTAENGDQALDVHISNSDISVNDSALANTAIASAANTMTVANTAEDIVVAPLTDRKYLLVYNKGNKKIYVGASGVSATDGFPISPGAYMEMRAGASVDIEWVSSDTNQEVRTLELS